jgi:hypothetical protein
LLFYIWDFRNLFFSFPYLNLIFSLQISQIICLYLSPGKRPDSKPAPGNCNRRIGQGARTGQPPFSRGIRWAASQRTTPHLAFQATFY